MEGKPDWLPGFPVQIYCNRIEAIMKFKKTSIWACILALALIAGATTAFAAARTDDNMELIQVMYGSFLIIMV